MESYYSPGDWQDYLEECAERDAIEDLFCVARYEGDNPFPLETTEAMPLHTAQVEAKKRGLNWRVGLHKQLSAYIL